MTSLGPQHTALNNRVLAIIKMIYISGVIDNQPGSNNSYRLNSFYDLFKKNIITL